ncbi:unnamed protein product [Clonostachys rosea]|uniref:Uncharacterized protein n=1 Tax=Bionectria ochroleuca TaxID=29856 RepID=A0ABY6TVZ9_BIOOC|nr:unnamed protein product [Clonostachys rosea]
MHSVRSLFGLAAISPMLASAFSTYNATFHSSSGCGDSAPYSMNGSRYTDCVSLNKTYNSISATEDEPSGYCHFFLFSDTACAVEITTQDNLDGECENVSGIQSFRDIIFHVNSDYSISYFTSSVPDESQFQQYGKVTLKVSANTIKVNKELPIIAAVAYSNPSPPKPCNNDSSSLGDDEVRVYFVNDDFKIVEVKRSGPANNNTWEYGKEFTPKQYSIFKKSGLSANVVPVKQGGHQLKVYFMGAEGQLSVAYRVLGTKEWNSRPNITN